MKSLCTRKIGFSLLLMSLGLQVGAANALPDWSSNPPPATDYSQYGPAGNGSSGGGSSSSSGSRGQDPSNISSPSSQFSNGSSSFSTNNSLNSSDSSLRQEYSGSALTVVQQRGQIAQNIATSMRIATCGTLLKYAPSMPTARYTLYPKGHATLFQCTVRADHKFAFGGPVHEREAFTRVIGYIDSVRESGQNSSVVSGWACNTGQDQAIKVHVYVGGPAGVGKLLGAATANQKATAGVSKLCSSSAPHRFSFLIGPKTTAAYRGEKVYIYGISISAGPNRALNRSGEYRLP